tara:strand:+ start:280 stop:789 length:510 start_codon:yes stop_codon:yes gene_type:complete
MFHFQEHKPDPHAEPILSFPRFSNSADVMTYFRTNRERLTQDQIDNLVDLYDSLSGSRPARNISPIVPPTVSKPGASVALENGWKAICESTSSDAERKEKLAELSASLLGESTPFRCRRVMDAYNTFGVKPTNRAVIELAEDNLPIDSKFKYLHHRAKNQQAHGEAQAV